jgi:hypothetical protein
MLFFFELFLFVLIMLTLALGEFVSRWLALLLWLVVTGFALVGYLLASRSGTGLTPQPSHERPPTPRPPPARAGEGAPAGGESSELDERWARTLLYNWRRTNLLLLGGALVVAVWWWLGG